MSINVQSWLTQYMSEIDCLQNEKSRFILRCSIIDAFAQSAYPNAHHTSTSFSSFIENYSAIQYSNILKLICPITLYYNCRDRYNLESLHLNTQYNIIYLANNIELSNEASRILNLIPDEKLDKPLLKSTHTLVLFISAGIRLSMNFMTLNLL